MALIECPECKKMISELAKSCPKCGAPVEKNIEKLNDGTALRECPECKNKISESSEECPVCGHPLKQNVDNSTKIKVNDIVSGYKTLKIFIAIIIFLIVLQAIRSCIGDSIHYMNNGY